MVHLRTVCYGGQPSRGLPTVAHAPVKQRERRVEAPPGFEPGVEVLQTSALPLGDGAPVEIRAKVGLPSEALGHPSLAAESEGWSGKRDSNPRLRPWQGRTLPLSYSRSNPQRTITTALNARPWRPPPAPSD